MALQAPIAPQGAADPQGGSDPITTLIDGIRSQLDALEAALGIEAPGSTGAETPEPAPTDAEVVAGIKRPPSGGMFGGGR